METTFHVLLTGLDGELQKQLELLLAPDGTTAAEGIAEPRRNLHRAMARMASPGRTSSPDPESLMVEWETGLDRAQLHGLVAPFQEAGLAIGAMLFVPEGGDAIWVRSLDEKDWMEGHALVVVRGDFSNDRRIANRMTKLITPSSPLSPPGAAP